MPYSFPYIIYTMKKKLYIAHMFLRARRKLGWRQSELARRLQISRARLCHYEKGRRVPSTEVIDRLKQLLGGTAQHTLSSLL